METNDPDNTPFSDDDRLERDRVVREAQEIQADIGNREAEFGRHLRDINKRKLYSENNTSWPDFVAKKFGLCSTGAYDYIGFADVCDALLDAGDEPLTVKSHALDVVQLPTAELQVAAVQRGRDLAAERGTRLIGEILKQACKEVAVAQGEDVLPGTNESFSARNEADRVAVRQHNGLTVVLAKNSVDENRALANLPGGQVVPYAEDMEWKTRTERVTDADGFDRIDGLDDVTGLAWTVVTSDPWETATTWSPASDRAVFFPERLTAPQARVNREASDREQTVLVAPGTDLFSDIVPDRVVHDIIGNAGADPRHRYLVMTRHADRAKSLDLSPNVFVCAEATGTAASVSAAAGALAGIRPNALVVRDLIEAVSPGVLSEIDWILVRGSKTTQKAYDSLRAGLKNDQVLDRGRDVKARHSGYPVLQTATKK